MTSTKVASGHKAVILLSGGLDSATALAIAVEQGYEAYAISFDYRQRHHIELEAAKKVAARLKTKKHLITSFDLREIGGSALTSDMPVPKGRAQANTSKEHSGIPVTYVPARNTIFLSFALAWAEILETPNIFIGANVLDYSGYPDCRPEYLSAFENMSNLATRATVEGRMKISIQAPLLAMTKAEIISLGAGLGLDYGLTWSCYDPQRSDSGEDRGLSGFRPCGQCDSCRLRKKGFAEAGLKDPLKY